MTSLVYQDGKNNLIYFNRGELVFRTLNPSPFKLNGKGHLGFCCEIFGINKGEQPRGDHGDVLIEYVEKLNHPDDCVLDIEATINLLRYRIIHKSLLDNLRK